MKNFLITAVYNQRNLIEDALISTRGQPYPKTEYVIIGGASTDGTLEYLEATLDDRTILVSEEIMETW